MEDEDESIILIWDSIEDTKVIPSAKISIGFTDEEGGFTVKLGKEGNMKDVIEYLK
jgi:hypothetical protein